MEPAWWIACRSPGNIIVNLPDVDDGSLTGYRRALGRTNEKTARIAGPP
jgi:hypothetical protein